MDPEDFQKLVHVGLRKLLLPWEENSAEQREYYLWSAESTDPFTVELEDEEDYDDDNDKSA